MKRPLLILAFVFWATNFAEAVTYYYQSGTLTTLGSWNTARNGTGTAPSAFNGSDSYVIQDAQSPIVESSWTTLSAGPRNITIESGGSLSSGSFNSSINLTLQGTSNYTVANSSYSQLSIISASASSTVTISGAATTVSSHPYSNLVWASSSGSSSTLGTFTTTGDLTIQGNSASRLLAGSGSNSNTWTLGGDLNVSSSKTLDLGAGSTGTGIINLSGGFSNSGTLQKGSANGNIEFNFSGTGSSDVTWGTVTNTNFANVTFTVGSSKTINFQDSANLGAAAFNVGGILNLGAQVLSGTSGTFTLDSGATLITSNTTGLDGAIAVTGAKSFSTSANYEFQGAGTGSLLPSTVNNLTINRSSGDVSLDGSGSTQTVSGALNVYSGNLAAGASRNTVNAGSLNMRNAQINSGVTVNLNGDVAFDSANNGTAIIAGNMGLGGSARTFAIADGSASTDMSISGQIGGSGGSLAKTGSGTLSLSGNNTYSGGTTVSNGTLIASHANALGSGNVSISGGTLHFNSVSVANDIALNSGTLTASAGGFGTSGALSGSGTIGSSLTVSTYNWLLTDNSTASQLTLAASSTLTLSTLNLSFANNWNPSQGQSFWNSNQSWTVVAGGTGSSITLASLGSGSTWGTGSFALSNSGTNLTLNWTATAVPEPSTYAAILGAVALVGVAAVRRRKRVAAA
ncbi:MAG: autotransporter-associated beta strand repeat-containing protein [Opitutaceae bacterium]|nr:autotransporter-associated beta strand repeat-containing protein [Opitutaceae bacterium]